MKPSSVSSQPSSDDQDAVVSVQLIYCVLRNLSLTNYLTVFYQINIMSYINCSQQNVTVATHSDHAHTNYV